MYFSRENVSDYREITLGPDGKFDLTGVPPESVSIGLRLNGYKISKKNESLDWLNGQILGKVSGDITDLNLLLEPGEWRYNEEEKDIPPGRERYPRDLPLRGAKVD